MILKLKNLKKIIFLFIILTNEVLAQPLSTILPKNGYVFNSDTVILSWNGINNATFYQLKYSIDSTFNSNVLQVNVGLQTNYMLSGLSSSTTYFWRIEADVLGNIVIGETSSFRKFRPTDIGGCALWLRSDTGVTLNGSTVLSWLDLSSNSYIAAQSNATAQPTYFNSGINNLPYLSFDGNDLLSVNSFSYGLNTSGFLVGKKTNSIVNHGNFTSGTYFDFEMQTLKCEVALNGGTTGSFNAINWSQITLKRQSGNSKVFINGLQSGQTNQTALSPISPGAFCIGGRNPIVNSPAPLRGELSELIVFNNAIDDGETQLIQKYLMDRYTPQLSLGPDTVIADNFCPVTISANSGFINYLWSTGETSPSINISKTGLYVVQATDIFDRIQSDSIFITYPNFQQINVNVLCAGSQLVWNTNLSSPYTFLWQDNSIGDNYLINQPGDYYVKVTDLFGCEFYSDTVTIELDNFPNTAYIGNDTSLCTGNSIQLQNGASTAVSYLWSDGTSNDSLFIAGGGSFWLEVSNANNCIARDTIFITLTGIAPTANFTSNNVCIGLSTQFNDLTIVAPGDSIVNWEWNFGDGNITSLQNPTNLYLLSGEYLVTLKSISQTGCAGLVNKYVQVLPHPILDFSVTNSCNEKFTQFANISNLLGGTQADILWDFNDPNSTNNFANGNSVFHNYNQVGPYQVTMVLNTIEGCLDTLIKQINIKPSPNADFEHTNLCVEDSVLFRDISFMPFPQQNLSRVWIFNDTIVSNDYEPMMYYQSDGIYPVRLAVLASNGCRDTIETTVEINNYPQPIISGAYPCKGSLSTFTDSSACINCQISSRVWLLDGMQISDSISAGFIINEVGAHSLQLIVSNSNSCQSTKTMNFNINPLPLADFTSNLSFGSPPLEVIFQNQSLNANEFQWSFGDGAESDFFEPFYLYNDTGLFTVKLTVKDTNGCTNSTSAFIKLLPKSIDVAILSADVTVKNGYLFTDIRFINLSSLTINSFDILISGSSNTNNLIERWEGRCFPGEIMTYRLKSSIFQSAENLTDFMCYEIRNIDKGTDEYFDNNRFCAVLNDKNFELSGVYPNPALDRVFLNLLSSNATNCTCEIIDFKGSVVHSEVLNIPVGFSSKSIDISRLSSGVYTIKINIGSDIHTKKISKINTQ
jgi:PKD repeat protein